MARLKSRTTQRYFEKGKYVKDGLYCWTKSGADFECKVECPYNERKAECDCHTAVSKDALDYINELEAKLADVVPKSEVEMLQGALKAEERHNELTMEMAQKALANAKAEVAREIFEDIKAISKYDFPSTYYTISRMALDELEKKYTEEQSDG